MKQNWYETAVEAIDNLSVQTPENGLVLYSVSYLKTEENKQKALRFVEDYPQKMLLEQTECGKKLLELGLEDEAETPEDRVKQHEIWSMFLRKGIAEARGNVTAFVDSADACGKFLDVCLLAILDNDSIDTINDVDKFDFVNEKVKWKHLGRNIDVIIKK